MTCVEQWDAGKTNQPSLWTNGGLGWFPIKPRSDLFVVRKQIIQPQVLGDGTKKG